MSKSTSLSGPYPYPSPYPHLYPYPYIFCLKTSELKQNHTLIFSLNFTTLVLQIKTVRAMVRTTRPSRIGFLGQLDLEHQSLIVQVEARLVCVLERTPLEESVLRNKVVITQAEEIPLSIISILPIHRHK